MATMPSVKKIPAVIMSLLVLSGYLQANADMHLSPDNSGSSCVFT